MEDCICKLNKKSIVSPNTMLAWSPLELLTISFDQSASQRQGVDCTINMYYLNYSTNWGIVECKSCWKTERKAGLESRRRSIWLFFRKLDKFLVLSLLLDFSSIMCIAVFLFACNCPHVGHVLSLFRKISRISPVMLFVRYMYSDERNVLSASRVI